MELKEQFKELEEKIISQNLYQRCPDYYEKCVQCSFWDDFDAIKDNILDLEKDTKQGLSESGGKTNG